MRRLAFGQGAREKSIRDARSLRLARIQELLTAVVFSFSALHARVHDERLPHLVYHVMLFLLAKRASDPGAEGRCVSQVILRGLLVRLTGSRAAGMWQLDSACRDAI